MIKIRNESNLTLSTQILVNWNIVAIFNNTPKNGMIGVEYARDYILNHHTGILVHTDFHNSNLSDNPKVTLKIHFPILETEGQIMKFFNLITYINSLK